MNRVKSTVATSAMPIGMPGWPEFAFSTASIASARMALAISRCVDRVGETLSRLQRSSIHVCPRVTTLRRFRSISCRMSGVRISCMARSSLLPGITIELARDMKLSWIIDSR